MNATPSDAPDPSTPVASTATVGGVPQKRGLLTEAEKRTLEEIGRRRDAVTEEYRDAVVAAAVRGASVRELAAFTGLSTNTISRWKREGR